MGDASAEYFDATGEDAPKVISRVKKKLRRLKKAFLKESKSFRLRSIGSY